MSDSPQDLDALREMPAGPDRVRAANAYIGQREDAIRAARDLRDDDIRAISDQHGPAETARLIGMSLATVKVLRRSR